MESNKVQYIIDRFEGEFAVCETSELKFVNILKKDLPKDVKEGDVLEFDGKKYVLDIDETKKRKMEIDDLTKDLWL